MNLTKRCWYAFKEGLPDGIGLVCRYGLIVIIAAWAIRYCLGAFDGYEVHIGFQK